MADGIITIKFVEGEVSTPGPQPINPNVDGTKKTEASKDNLLSTVVGVYAIKKAANLVKEVAIDEAKYKINQYFELTDNYLGQQSMNIALNIINKTVSTAGAVVAGAKLGGPVGAVLGLGASVITTGIQIQRNYEQQQIRMNKMNVELSFNRQRAGYSLTAGSVGENR